MKNKLLSIVIPTYNGGEWIEDTIESVASQVILFKDEVEFIVRDNASTDNIQDVVTKLDRKYSDIIKYNRRESTAIADVNYRESIELAEGEYIQLLGDDDLLFPGFVETTLRVIKSHTNLGLIYYNRISTTRDYQGANLKHSDPSKIFAKHYNNVKDFITDYPSGPDFMSVNVVKRDCLIKGLDFSKGRYYGVEWYAAILRGLDSYDCISFFMPMILQRAPKTRIWDDRALLYVIVGMDNVFQDLDPVYPGIHSVWNEYSKREISRYWYLTKCIPLNRGLYKRKYNELKQKLTGCENIVAWLLLYLPVSYYIFRGTYLIKKIIKNMFIIK